jgi:hypothetical protein
VTHQVLMSETVIDDQRSVETVVVPLRRLVCR